MTLTQFISSLKAVIGVKHKERQISAAKLNSHFKSAAIQMFCYSI